MGTQLEFLMQLYMMNLIQQQQQQLLQQQTMQQHQQQLQNKDKTSTELGTTLKGPHSPTNCSSSTSTSSSSNILLNTRNFSDVQNQYSNVPLANENGNLINSMYPVNFSKSFIQSSTVTSTPTDSATVTSIGHALITDDGECGEQESYSTGTTGSFNSGENSKISATILESPESFSSPIMPFTPLKCETSGLQSPIIGHDLSMDNSRSFNAFEENEDSNYSQKSAKISPNGSGSNGDVNVAVKSENSLMNFETFPGVNPPTGGVSADNILQNEECLKHLKKFPSYLECESVICRQEGIREHFHCYDQPCCGKVLNKRDEIIRHLKWHKKRKESLVYGFMRFSSSDDCSSNYGQGCAYNFKQTHYHCIEECCPKVYVSTSDVQMHANYHRKNSEIIQEGFKRFRAIEDCKTESCPFFGKKTSHYHCRRENCQFTFKNKADMDKHKSYHLRDMRLTQDGFKKILKTEACPFENCRFSNVCNHIHCVREGCNYILHSSSQLVSHKRKHERLDGEQAYQNFKKTQKEVNEDESPKSTPQTDVSTPLSSLTSDSSSFHFLARKRGRPPKKIQLSKEAKKIKLETSLDQPTAPLANTFPFAPLLPQFGNSSQDSVTPPNFQLTHLMAMFQLQNPLFYQNLYPGGMLGLAGAGGASGNGLGMFPQNSIFPTPNSTPSQGYVKSEDKTKE